MQNLILLMLQLRFKWVSVFKGCFLCNNHTTTTEMQDNVRYTAMPRKEKNDNESV